MRIGKSLRREKLRCGKSLISDLMQKQNHKILLSGGQAQLEELEKQGHGGEVKQEGDTVYLICTEDHAHPKTLTQNVEESFTRKPRLSQAEELLEEIGGV